jgi:polyphosphate kinase
MDRNLSRRVEVVWPVEQPDLKRRMLDEILAVSRHDTVKARRLLPDGHWERVTAPDDQPRRRSQERFLALAAEAAARIPTEPGILAPVTTTPDPLAANRAQPDGRREPRRARPAEPQPRAAT